MGDINDSEWPATWPKGTGEWATSTVIVSRDAGLRMSLRQARRPDTQVVGTPLELIAQLEDTRQIVTKVVLVGDAVAELSEFMRETYPSVALVAK
jgi:hypothetical protein